MSKSSQTISAKDNGPAEDGSERPSKYQAIRDGVLSALGRPPELCRVDIRPLWGNNYRVNVIVGREPITVSIAHSFFVELGEAGDIRSANPRIARRYV